MSNKQNIDAFFNGFNAHFETIVPNVIAETATEFFKDRFKFQSWDGVPWQPLSTKYAAKKTKGRGRILTQSSALRNSIKPSIVSTSRVVISAGGSKVPYARVHNEGLQVKGIRSVRSYTNRNFMGKGKPVQIRAHKRAVNYVMPRRQFMGYSPILNRDIKQRLQLAWNAQKY
ncbi:phage virion morphogenesis protein [Cellulophaga lytica]|uniref:phage virion morphogenesis protein n=1 Tax=Cellulophaga lytica TaxID=979 RepID=UPI003CE45D3B